MFFTFVFRSNSQRLALSAAHTVPSFSTVNYGASTSAAAYGSSSSSATSRGPSTSAASRGPSTSAAARRSYSNEPEGTTSYTCPLCSCYTTKRMNLLLIHFRGHAHRPAYQPQPSPSSRPSRPPPTRKHIYFLKYSIILKILKF